MFTGARSTNHAPSGKSGWSTAATCSPSLVLPTPPGPVSVTTAVSATSPVICSIDAARPTNRFGGTGRFPASSSTDCNAGNSRSRSGCTTWNTRSGSPQIAQPVLAEIHQLDRTAPHQLTRHRRHHHLAAVRDAHQASGTVHRAAVVVAVAQLRLARCAGPSAPERPGHAHGSSPSASCAATAASTASWAVPNAAWNPSPVVFTTYPAWPSIASRTIAS